MFAKDPEVGRPTQPVGTRLNVESFRGRSTRASTLMPDAGSSPGI